MADDKVQFEVVTPTSLLVSTLADMVVVPGGDGDFGILPGHAPLMSTVRPGMIKIYEGDKIVDRFFIAGGFAEVSDAGLSVLAEEAEHVNAIDVEKARARVEACRADIDAAAADKAGEAESALKLAEAYLEAAEGIDGRSPQH